MSFNLLRKEISQVLSNFRGTNVTNLKQKYGLQKNFMNENLDDISNELKSSVSALGYRQMNKKLRLRYILKCD